MLNPKCGHILYMIYGDSYGSNIFVAIQRLQWHKQHKAWEEVPKFIGILINFTTFPGMSLINVNIIILLKASTAKEKQITWLGLHDHVFEFSQDMLYPISCKKCHGNFNEFKW